MKSVLISIQPKWCELIASGKKTVEVRKTRPKLETPFKVYIYCTQGLFKDLGIIGNEMYQKRMKVIGEFVCDKIVEFENSIYDEALPETVARSCVPMYDLLVYLGKQDYGFGWHISDLVIYDQPKELSEFCSYDARIRVGENGYPMPTHEITRPPQSWCYVKGGE